jgi:hypothetical protein
MNGLFGLSDNPITFDTKETVIELNGVHIEAYPSHHLDSMRGLKDVFFIYLDEADFFPPGQQQDARDVSERYIAKSNPHIVMVSTPNAPEGLFERIEKEPEDSCLYKKLFLDYTCGLGRIYTEEEITAAKASPSFEREYNLKYIGFVGNVHHTKDIEAALALGNELGDPMIIANNPYSIKSMGIDPGYSASAFGICITSFEDGKARVLYANEFSKPDFNEMLRLVGSLLLEYGVSFQNSSRIFVDAANTSFIRSLTGMLGEHIDYLDQIERLKKNNPGIVDKDSLVMNNMFLIPVAFNKEGKNMLSHVKLLMERKGVAIHPRFNKLLIALRTATENGEGKLDKDAASHDDLYDAWRMSLERYV